MNIGKKKQNYYCSQIMIVYIMKCMKLWKSRGIHSLIFRTNQQVSQDR